MNKRKSQTPFVFHINQSLKNAGFLLRFCFWHSETVKILNEQKNMGYLVYTYVNLTFFSQMALDHPQI